MSIFVIGKKLGKGSFGSVYEAEDDSGKKYAVKTIDIKGYNYIMEASVSATYRHPNIVSSEDIFIEGNKLYIVQKRALGDLMALSRGNPIKLEKVCRYSYSIAKAINFLHSRNVIHGDIKASNIFLYNDDTVKLGDFSVSLLALKEKYTHKISTPSHNPPECFNKEEWSFPVDMWCFGCTIYEIAYGANIFPSQKESKDFDRMDILKICIFDWIADNEGIDVQINIHKNYNDNDEEDNKEIKNVPIKKVKHPNLFYNRRYKPLNNLILNLLRCDPNKRFTSEEVLKHYFFCKEWENDTDDSERLILKNKKHNLSSEDVINLNKYNITDPSLNLVASKILSLCSKEFRNQHKEDIYEMCIVVSHILNKVKIPTKLLQYDPEKLMVYLGYSVHESL